MIKYLVILLLSLNIYGSNILSYNIYERTDRVDVMITFDTPYNGTIKQSKSKTKIIIKLEDAKIESSKLKQLSSNYISTLSITPIAGYTQIVAKIPEKVILQASKTSDSYGLRLRFSDSSYAKKIQTKTTESENTLSSLPTKKSTEISTSYYIVITILIIGIIILFYLKKKVTTNNTSNNSWLFKDTKINQSINNQSSNNNLNNEAVSIRFQKKLNEENSVVMLDFGVQSYLVLMGKNNILLDKFTDNKPATQSDFETILQNRHQELDNFLRGEDENELQNNTKEQLYSYTNKASHISYEV
jgi:hypothetical protein